jgi:hypothetical protein
LIEFDGIGESLGICGLKRQYECKKS